MCSEGLKQAWESIHFHSGGGAATEPLEIKKTAQNDNYTMVFNSLSVANFSSEHNY